MSIAQPSESQTVGITPSNSEPVISPMQSSLTQDQDIHGLNSTPSSPKTQPKAKKRRHGRQQHPAFFKKGTNEYREAVENFFEVSVEPSSEDVYKDWIFPYSSYAAKDPPSIKEMFKDVDRINNDESLSNSLQHVDEINGYRALSGCIEPAAVAAEESMSTHPTLISPSDLCDTYIKVCKAVSEIEFNASTLRTNSRALALAKKLVGEGVFGIFQVLSDFEPQWERAPQLPAKVNARLSKWDATRTRKWSYVHRYFMDAKVRLASGREKRKSRSLLDIDMLDWASFEWGSSMTHVWRARYADISAWKRMVKEKRELRWKWDWESAKSEVRWWKNVALEQLEGFPSEMEANSSETSEGYLPVESETFAWAERMKCVHKWFETDRLRFPDEWDEGAWKSVETWWEKFDKWEKRQDERIQKTEFFAEISIDLMKELEKVDGIASTKDLSIVLPIEEDFQSLQFEDCILEMEAEVGLQAIDRRRFMSRCNEVLLIIEKRLRSDALKQGFEALIKKQDHLRNSFMDFATVAIFFSSITATTLQFSFTAADTSFSSTIVNLCWFASLILSIASATNSFLGAVVHQSPEYLRPSASLNFRFLQSWFKFVPPMFLSISGLLFLVGTCAFTFLSTNSSPSQGNIIKNVTIGLTSSNVLLLVTLILLAFTRIIQRTTEATIHFTSPFARIAVHLTRPAFQITIMAGISFLVLILVLPHFLYVLIRYRELNVDHDTRYREVIGKMIEPLEPLVKWCWEGLEEFWNDARGVPRRCKQFFDSLSMRVRDLFRRVSPRSTTNTPSP